MKSFSLPKLGTPFAETLLAGPAEFGHTALVAAVAVPFAVLVPAALSSPRARGASAINPMPINAKALFTLGFLPLLLSGECPLDTSTTNLLPHLFYQESTVLW